MRYLIFSFACLLLALQSSLDTVRADNNGDDQFRSDLWCDGPYDVKHPLAFESLKQRIEFETLIGNGDWQEADRRISEAFRQFIVNLDTSTVDPQELQELQEFGAGMEFYMADLIQNFQRWKPLESHGDELKYELPIGDDVLSAVVKVECNRIDQSKASAAIAYTASSLYQAGETGHGKAIKIAAAKLDTVYQTHRNRLFNGLPMWPWETWANGLDIDFATEEPAPAPRNQWVIMRPSLSPALKFDGSANSELDVGLVLEPAGYVRYLKDDFSKWVGISPIVTITNSNGIGYGGLLRYNNWQIGAAYHDFDNNVLLYVSLDLYDFVVGKDKKTSSANAFLKDLSASLIKK
jgi:hypothetical protein